jgi:hypothetical protein
VVDALHQLLYQLPRHTFPLTATAKIPSNGVYILFEKGETRGAYDRIVRVGTHTGQDQLPSRLHQHFMNENKNRSIFRKNIGRALLNEEQHPYLPLWELNVTSRADREKNAAFLDTEFEKGLERRVSVYIGDNFSFCTFRVDSKEDRLMWESRIVSTLAQAGCTPSEDWLGNHSPKQRIRESGLWQVNELYNDPLSAEELETLSQIVRTQAVEG